MNSNSLFSLSDHLEKLSKDGDPLEVLDATVDFEYFRGWLVESLGYGDGSTVVTSNLPFDEWTSTFGSQRLTGALLDRLTHHVHILEMNGDSYRLKQSNQSLNA